MLAGAHLVVAPTAMGEAWPHVAHKVIPTRAFENGVGLVYANHAGEEAGLNYLGASCIVRPDGHDLARTGLFHRFLLAVRQHAIDARDCFFLVLPRIEDLAACGETPAGLVSELENLVWSLYGFRGAPPAI